MITRSLVGREISNESILAILRETLEGSNSPLVVDDRLSAETDLVAGGIDSLDMVELYLRIESEFGIKIPDSERAALRSVGSLATFLTERASAG